MKEFNQIFTKSGMGLTSPPKLPFDSVKFSNSMDVLWEAKACWDGLLEFRRERQRNGRYLFGKHWEDMVPDPNRLGQLIKEAELIKSQGRVPIVHNLIRQLTKTVVGQFRSTQTEGVVTVRDSDKNESGEMMSIALQGINQNNQTWQLDAEALLEALNSAVVFQKAKWDFLPNDTSKDVYIENKNPARMFWNADMEDTRTWDLRLIGEIHDLRIADVLSAFSDGNRAKAVAIRDIYKMVNQESIYDSYSNMTNVRIDNLDFFLPFDDRTCRVLEIWRLESKEQYLCHDWLKGEEYWVNLDQKKYIQAENNRRALRYVKNGVAEEDMLLIDYKWDIHKFWYYRFMTPFGDVLKEGESPYWHESHPYTMRTFNSYDGRPHSFVSDVIDQNRMINRMFTQWDFIQSTSAKNPLVYDEGIVSISPEELDRQYTKPGGQIPVKLSAGKKLNESFLQLKGIAPNVGNFEMIDKMLQFMDSISGVHGAMRGEKAKAGSSSALYAQEVQNSSINLIDLFESFKMFRIDRDMKSIQIIQQYYTTLRYINIGGSSYSNVSKWYDPEKTRNCRFTLTIDQNAATENYRAVTNQFLMQLFEGGKITLKMLLENGNFPFADRLMQSIEANEKQLQQGQPMEGMPNMQQLQGQ